MKTDQDKNRAFVDKFVLLNQCYLVDEMLKKVIFSIDDVENLYRINQDALKDAITESIDDDEVYKGYVNDWLKENKTQLDSLDEEDLIEIAELIDLEPHDYDEPQEVLEWWLVDSWLLDKLEAKGEPVLRNSYGDWWGRTCSGQAILLDSVINEIREEFE